jgi:hypothetical protein
VREASFELQVRRETRSYFWALTEVIVKVSSKRSGSDMMEVATAGFFGLWMGIWVEWFIHRLSHTSYRRYKGLQWLVGGPRLVKRRVGVGGGEVDRRIEAFFSAAFLVPPITIPLV